MSESGYLYALVNSSFPNYVKIGKTTIDPEIRAKELSSATGVPTPFIVTFHIYVNDCSSAEKYLHDLLEEKGYRLSPNREFFLAPIKEVIEYLIQIENLPVYRNKKDQGDVPYRRDYPPSGETDLNKLDIEQLRKIDRERRKTEEGL